MQAPGRGRALSSLTIFLLGIVLAGSGLISAPVALAGGMLFGLTVEPHPLAVGSRALSRFLLQASVVLLGFGMDLREVLRAGRSGLLYTAISIVSALLLGWALARLLRVSGTAGFLITCGTAICGGSAIAAIAPVVHAGEEDMAVSLGTVFTLNALALLIFPPLGARLHLSQTQFGLWAALAIHDTSSVVGAASRYGAQALVVGTTVKLVRALWIVPLALCTAAFVRMEARKNSPANGPGATPGRIQLPWFIGFFLLAAMARAAIPADAPVFSRLAGLGRSSLVVVLYLIGTGLTRETLRRVGIRPMLQGVILWILIGSASLFAITRGWIAL